jgi:K+-transporting ATPase ATPase C chain
MFKVLYRSLMATLILVILTCGVYPLAVTGVGHLLFAHQAEGGLVMKGGKVVGAELIGQNFSKPEYFHPRPSAAGDKGYDAANSNASNLGPTNQKLADGLKANVDAVLKDNPTLQKGAIPSDLVTASASGLDPHITPPGARVQVDRVAQARKVAAAQIQALVDENTAAPQWGLFGEPVVNVLLLNLALDDKFPIAK